MAASDQVIIKGTIGVRTTRAGDTSRYEHAEGAIIICTREMVNGRLAYSNSGSVPRTDWRLATDGEVEAFADGITNIKDIPFIQGDYLEPVIT